jgi:4-hydroxybenzoate polyprenyltransferase
VRGGSVIILATLLISVALSGIIFWRAQLASPLLLCGGVLLSGFCLLLLPALRLFRTLCRDQASALFNAASYYPASLLALVATSLIW